MLTETVVCHSYFFPNKIPSVNGSQIYFDHAVFFLLGPGCAHKVSTVSLCHGGTVFHCPRAHVSHRPRSLVHRRGEHRVRNAAPYAPGRAPLKGEGTPRGGEGVQRTSWMGANPGSPPPAPGPLCQSFPGGRQDVRWTECFCAPKGEWPAAFSPAGGSTPLGRREGSRGGLHVPSVHSKALLSRPRVLGLYSAIHLECFFLPASAHPSSESSLFRPECFFICFFLFHSCHSGAQM